MDEELQSSETPETPLEPLRTLVIFATPADENVPSWEPVVELLRTSSPYPNCEWLLYETRVKNSITETAVDLRARIDQQFIVSGPYGNVVMIGVSIGAIVVRKAFLLSLGLYPDCPPTIGWAEQVSRIVLVAGPNRGIGLNAAPVVIQRIFKGALSFIPRSRFLIDLLTGSDFLTDLKIRWIYQFANWESAPPQVVHLLPALSGFLSRASMIDEGQFPGAHYIDAPGLNAEQMQESKRYVYDRTLFALLHTAVFAELMPPQTPRRADIDRVVFVMHGIRARNTAWVSQVSHLVKYAYPKTEVVVASYGYYSALRFAFALARHRNIRWFQDVYSHNFARFPNATFYFIGHSYGTYILGRSMARVPSMRFARIVLVGSVLPREYRWSERLDTRQTDEIRNDRSSSDIPVKVLCGALHAFGIDVGTSGVDGFDEGRCREVFYHKGNHSRPLDRDNLPALVDYLMEGTYVPPPGNLVEDITAQLGVASRLAPAIAMLVIFAILSVAPGLWWVYQNADLMTAIGTGLGLAFIAVLLDAF